MDEKTFLFFYFRWTSAGEKKKEEVTW